MNSNFSFCCWTKGEQRAFFKRDSSFPVWFSFVSTSNAAVHWQRCVQGSSFQKTPQLCTLWRLSVIWHQHTRVCYCPAWCGDGKAFWVKQKCHAHFACQALLSAIYCQNVKKIIFVPQFANRVTGTVTKMRMKTRRRPCWL